jgi:hypothetical protein
MGENQTLQVLGWTISCIVGVMFLLSGISLSMQ